VTSAAPIRQNQVLWQPGREQCQIECYVLNAMAKEQFLVVHVVVPAEELSWVSQSVAVKNAMELDGVVAMSVAVLAKSNQQTPKRIFADFSIAAEDNEWPA
jgi:hypothetical protein